MKLIRDCGHMAVLVLSGLLLWPAVSYAEPDLDVTMRMVTDDDTLSDSVVQEIQLPDPSIEAVPGERRRSGAGKELQHSNDKENSRQNRGIDDSGRHWGESVSDHARGNKHDFDKLHPPKPDSPGKPDFANGK